MHFKVFKTFTDIMFRNLCVQKWSKGLNGLSFQPENQESETEQKSSNFDL